MIANPYCRARGCFDHVQQFGLCRTHFDWATGRDKPVRYVPMSERTCDIEGCNELIAYSTRSGGHCDDHHRSPEATAPQACTIEGCEQSRVYRDYCRPHYKAWKQRGDPLSICSVEKCSGAPVSDELCRRHVPAQDKPRCATKDCTRPVTGRGLCSSHYAKDWKARRALAG